MEKIKYDPERKSPLIINLNSPYTGITNCVCDRERFLCRDFIGDTPFAGLRYQEYRNWLILEKLTDVVLYFKPYCVVEIGAGVSSKVLGKVTELHGVDFHSVDTKPEKECKFHLNHYYHNMRSEEFMKEFNDNPAVVLIDGNHNYDVAKMEFDFFFEKLVPGGVIFLHDTMPPHENFVEDTGCGDVYKLRQELERRSKDLDCFTWPYTAEFMGLTMIIKKEKNRRFFEK